MTVENNNKNSKIESAYLIGIKILGGSDFESTEHLNELKELVDTMGLKTAASEIVTLREINSAYYIGSGKVKEIGNTAKQKNAQCIIVDFELSPSQQRNWEKETGLYVIDRQEVIINIFAARAKTREAVVQVELARMGYMLPRLKSAWTHLSRQRGGLTGARGEGEKQIEIDRRLIQAKISKLKEELKELSKHRAIQRAKREKIDIPIGAIIGYTNAGKSSLLNLLSGSNVYVEDKLFATLDPTTRIVELSNTQKVILSDTVGFIRKLPHTLVEAFKSTLEEAVNSDFLIHVLDISNPSVEQHRDTTFSILNELKAINKPSVIIFNKIDKINDTVLKARLRSIHPNAVFISVKTGEGVELLKKEIEKIITRNTELLYLKIPITNFDIISRICKTEKTINISYEENYAIVTARISKNNKKIYENFIIKN